MIAQTSPGCPDDTTLERLARSEATHDVDADDASINPDQVHLWSHIESCVQCQERLELLAAAERQELSRLLGIHDGQDVTRPPFQPLPDDAQPKIAGFQILRELGRGGGSTVYLADELATSRQVALKVIAIEPGDSSLQRQDWLSEVRASARIEHPNVVRLYRVEETSECFLLVFEYVSGGTLRSWQNRPVSQIQIARFVETLARTIAQIHQRGILHLDLKPSNILMDTSGGSSWEDVIPKIADFGISSARFQSPQTSSGQQNVRGTPAFMAPEQLVGEPSLLSPATDLYGLGGILYCLLTGRSPSPVKFSDGAIDELLETSIVEPKAVDPTIDADLSRITSRCLNRNPQDRFASANDLADELHRWLQKNEGSSRPVPAPARRSAMAWTFATVLATAFLLLLQRLLSEPTFNSTLPALAVSETSPNAGEASLADVVNRRLEQPFDESVGIDEASLLQRLSELPPAFDIERAAQLVVDNQRFTDLLLAEGSADRCLQFAILQYASAARFQEGGLTELYSTAPYLLHDSVRLLTHVQNQVPEDQIILQKLIASMFALGMVRVDKGPNTADNVERHIRDRLLELRRTIPLLRRLSDRKQRVYWAGVLIDSFRLAYWNARFTQDDAAAELFRDWEQEAWTAFASDQSTPDLAVRHTLFHPDLTTLIAADSTGQWVLRDDRRVLQREYLSLRIAERFFSRTDDNGTLVVSPLLQQQLQSEGSESIRSLETSAPSVRDASSQNSNSEADSTARDAVQVWSECLMAIDRELKSLQIESLTVPMMIHEDLIRPLTTLCTQYRAEGQIDRAEALQQRYLDICEAAIAIYPDDADVHLAFSEAHLQAWKNALRRERPDIAVNNLEKSLVSAQAAVQSAPRSPRARDQVADRIKRLTRFYAARKTGSNTAN